MSITVRDKNGSETVVSLFSVDDGRGHHSGCEPYRRVVRYKIWLVQVTYWRLISSWPERSICGDEDGKIRSKLTPAVAADWCVWRLRVFRDERSSRWEERINVQVVKPI